MSGGGVTIQVNREAQTLAAAAAEDLKDRAIPDRPMLVAAPPVRVIDCVLSLRRNYKRFVCPRVAEYQQRFPEVRTCADLAEQIRSFGSPLEFMAQVLRFRSPGRAITLLGVAERLSALQPQFGGASESERLVAWAQQARPQDYIAFGVRGFGIAGFQYLRMLFGANTVKPDVHISRYVSHVLSRPVPDMEAIVLVEQASLVGGWRAESLDGMIWERGAKW